MAESDGSSAGIIFLVFVVILMVLGTAGALVYFLVLKPKWDREAKINEEDSTVNLPAPNDAVTTEPKTGDSASTEPATTEQVPTSGMNPVQYNVRLKILNTSATVGGYLSPCGLEGACGVDVTIRPDTSFTPTPNVDTYKQREWMLEPGTGAVGPSVRYGDKVKIKSLSTYTGETDLYLSPCGNTGTLCGIDATLRPASSYASDVTLREWLIMGGVAGQAVQYDDVVQIVGTNTTYKNHNLPLASCGEESGCGHDVTLVNNPDTSKWQFKSMTA